MYAILSSKFSSSHSKLIIGVSIVIPFEFKTATDLFLSEKFSLGGDESYFQYSLLDIIVNDFSFFNTFCLGKCCVINENQKNNNPSSYHDYSIKILMSLK